MNAKTAQHTRLRDRLPLAPKYEDLFRWRGNDVTRVEGFTDGVFAFAVTLLVVALEVPHDFDGLMNVVRGFPAFVICFTLLMMFWNAHYRYQRRYGFDDTFTRMITLCILVLVLFFVYPLKFLFTMVTVNLFGLEMQNAPRLQTYGQVQTLYVIYGLGFAGVWSLFALLYVHALRAREQLALSASELMLTRGTLAQNGVYVGVCLLSVALALTTRNESLPGYIYFLLGPLQAWTGWRFESRARALATA